MFIHWRKQKCLVLTWNHALLSLFSLFSWFSLYSLFSLFSIFTPFSLFCLFSLIILISLFSIFSIFSLFGLFSLFSLLSLFSLFSLRNTTEAEYDKNHISNLYSFISLHKNGTFWPLFLLVLTWNHPLFSLFSLFT